MRRVFRRLNIQPFSAKPTKLNPMTTITHAGHLLPNTIRQIADVVGLDIAMKIALELGGRRYAIPQKSTGTKLEKVIGPDAAEKLCTEFAWEIFDIPLVNTQLIFWLRNQGWSLPEIASRLRVSRRKVQYVLSGKTPSRTSEFITA